MAATCSGWGAPPSRKEPLWPSALMSVSGPTTLEEGQTRRVSRAPLDRPVASSDLLDDG